MKKNFIKVAFVAAFAAIAGYGVYTNQKTDSVSDLVLANVDALANDDEYSDGKEYKWSGMIDCPGWWTGDYQVCQENGPGNACSDPGAVTCNCGSNC